MKKATEKPFKKSTVAEIDNRVSEVMALLLSGTTRSGIVRHGSKWGVSSRQIDDYIAAATKEIKEVNSLTLQENQGIILSNLWALFKQCSGTFLEADEKLGLQAKYIPPDTAEQHKILMSIAKLKGLDQMTVNHIIEDKRELAEMTDEELEAIIVEAPKELLE